MFFEHDEHDDRIVFSDRNSGFRAVEGAEALSYQPRGERADVFDLEANRRIIPSLYVVSDYNHRHPHVDLTATHELSTGFAGGIVEQSSHHRTPEEGAALARVRAEERRAAQLVYTGRSLSSALSAGMRFKLDDHPDLPSVELVVTEVEHHASQVVANAALSSDEARYVCTFQAVPADRPYRPPQETPKPRIAGLVTGIIDAGPSGVTTRAQLDEHGDYLVRFMFDQAPPTDRAPSPPLRMVQNYAGESYGTYHPLKPGTEVLLSFIDGDLDRPVIVGAVFNAAKPSPINSATAITHRIRTRTGITVDMVERT
jgi:type VI secretion system secreted protein VgrG